MKPLDIPDLARRAGIKPMKSPPAVLALGTSVPLAMLERFAAEVLEAANVQRMEMAGMELCEGARVYARRADAAIYLAYNDLTVPDHLLEAVSEARRALNSDIYYFRKHSGNPEP